MTRHLKTDMQFLDRPLDHKNNEEKKEIGDGSKPDNTQL